MLKSVKFWVVVVITTTSVLAALSAWNDSVIVDEVPHIGAGYSYLVKQDMRLNPEHPPLAKDVAAIPLLFLHLKQTVFTTPQWLSDLNGQWYFGRYLMFNSDNDADKIKHAVKLPMLLFFIFTALLIFRWTKRQYGELAALLATTLFAFSPTVLAHSRFVTTDVPALFGVTLATYCFLRYLNNPSRKNVWWAGLSLGIALLTKFSTILLLPFFVVLALVWIALYKNFKFHAWRCLYIGLIAFLLIVWPVYFFHTYHYPPERQHSDTQSLLSSYGHRQIADTVVWSSDKPLLRPLAQYSLGLLLVNQRATGGNTTYFFGEVTSTGWHRYFPIVYFIKEPLAWWGLVLLALVAVLNKFSLRLRFSALTHWLKDHFTEFALLLWLAIYWGISIKSNLNIGVRHLLPTYSFAIILVSGRVIQLIKSRVGIVHRLLRITVVVLLIWYAGENFYVYPYYLSYFNETVGGPSGGYRYVVDSNLDWGQDLLRFSQWVKQNNLQKIELDYFGWADPFYYLKDRYLWTSSTKYRDLADFKARNQSNGWLAVSAEFLQGSRGTPEHPQTINYNNWLKPLTPVTVIGHSIFVYHLP